MIKQNEQKTTHSENKRATGHKFASDIGWFVHFCRENMRQIFYCLCFVLFSSGKKTQKYDVYPSSNSFQTKLNLSAYQKCNVFSVHFRVMFAGWNPVIHGYFIKNLLLRYMKMAVLLSALVASSHVWLIQNTVACLYALSLPFFLSMWIGILANFTVDIHIFFSLFLYSPVIWFTQNKKCCFQLWTMEVSAFGCERNNILVGHAV